MRLINGCIINILAKVGVIIIVILYSWWNLLVIIICILLLLRHCVLKITYIYIS